MATSRRGKNVPLQTKTSDGSEDDGTAYCICGMPSTSDMVACDNDQCSVVWWHFHCAGLTADAIPEDSWICALCKARISDAMAVKQSPILTVDVQTQQAYVHQPEDSNESRKQQKPKKYVQQTQVGRKSFKDKITQRMMEGKYSSAVRFAMANSARASAQILRLFRVMVFEEMKKFVKMRPYTLAGGTVTRDNADNFQWQSFVDECLHHLPLLCSVLTSCLAKNARSCKHVMEMYDACIEGRHMFGLGLLLAMMLKMRSRHFKLIPSLIGLSLYRHGCSTILLSSLCKTGICPCPMKIRSSLTNLGERYHKEVITADSEKEELSDEDSSSDEESSSEDEENEESRRCKSTENLPSKKRRSKKKLATVMAFQKSNGTREKEQTKTHTQTDQLSVKMKDRISKCIMHGNYSWAVRLAMENCSTASSQILKLFRLMVYAEMRNFVALRPHTIAGGDVNRYNAEGFQWREFIAECQHHLPLLSSVLSSSLAKQTRSCKHVMEMDDILHANENHLLGLGTILAMVLRMSSRHLKLIPMLIGLSLYRHGCSPLVLNSLSKTGICPNPDEIQTGITQLGERFHKEVITTDSAMEESSDGESSSDLDSSSEEDEEDELQPQKPAKKTNSKKTIAKKNVSKTRAGKKTVATKRQAKKMPAKRTTGKKGERVSTAAKKTSAKRAKQTVYAEEEEDEEDEEEDSEDEDDDESEDDADEEEEEDEEEDADTNEDEDEEVSPPSKRKRTVAGCRAETKKATEWMLERVCHDRLQL